MDNTVLVPVIICGGGGSRLWPISRRSFAKPFVALPGQSHSLLAQTYARLQHAPSPTALITVAAAADLFLCKEIAAAHAPAAAAHLFIGEPEGRGTAPAILSAACWAAERFGTQAMLLVLPADHLVKNVGQFWRAAELAMQAAARHRLALLGIAPEYAATGYGYIECGEEEAESCYMVRRFIEKPSSARAKSLIVDGGFLWNAGIFCMRVDALLSEVAAVAPSLVAVAAQKPPPVADTWLPVAAEYAAFPNISLDYAVMEKTNNASAVVAAGAQWSDVGSWRAIGDSLAADKDGNRNVAGALLLDCKNCLVSGTNRQIVAVDVADLHIIDTPDALLVAAADSAERVREVVDKLRADNIPQADTGVAERRPWGGYTVLEESAGYKVKRIEVLPGGVLSLQSHRHRHENWTVVLGEMTVMIGDQELHLSVGESCAIAAGVRHRMRNDTAELAALIEVQTGAYLGEDDITRYDDIYGRC